MDALFEGVEVGFGSGFSAELVLGSFGFHERWVPMDRLVDVFRESFCASLSLRLQQLFLHKVLQIIQLLASDLDIVVYNLVRLTELDVALRL